MTRQTTLLSGVALLVTLLGCSQEVPDGPVAEETHDATTSDDASTSLDVAWHADLPPVDEPDLGPPEDLAEEADPAPFCGDGACLEDEDCISCPDDCGPCQSLCGNGVLDEEEQCDDANQIPWDGCDGCRIVEFQVNETAAGDQLAAGVVTFADGVFTVFWEERSKDAQRSQMARTFDGDGAPLGPEWPLLGTRAVEDQVELAAAPLLDDRMVLVYSAEGEQDKYNDALFAIVDVQSTEVLREPAPLSPSSDGDQRAPSVASLPDGSFVAAWSTDKLMDDANGIFARRYGADGELLGESGKVDDLDEDFAYEPMVAGLHNGDYVILWTASGPDGDLGGIFGRVYDANDVPTGPVFQVNSTWTNFQVDEAVEAFSDGRFIAAWQSENQDGSLGGTFARLFQADGTPQGSEFQVNTYIKSCQDKPDIATFATGDFVITWRSSEQDGSGWGIYAQFFGADAAPRGPELAINTYTTGNQWFPFVAAQQDGGAIIVWSSHGQDGDGYGTYAQRFNADGSRRYH